MRTAEVIQEGNATRLKINGAVDQDFKFPEDLNCELVIVDFDGLTVMNSIGIRSWLSWTAGKKGFKSMKLEHCPPIFIDQAAHILGMIPAYASVESFYAPFYESETQVEKSVLLVRGKDFGENGLTLPKVVNEKGNPYELDVPNSYFDFLKKK